MRPTLRELDGKSFDQGRVAERLPTSWKEAIAAYVEDRTAVVKQPLMDLRNTTEWAAKDIAHQCKALRAIQAMLAKEVKKKPTLKIADPSKRSRLQHDIDLAALLTPDGWHQNYMPAIQALREQAEADILKEENVRLNQAMGFELDELVRFLRDTEQRGRTALAELERDKRGMAPRRIGPPVSADRFVM